MICKQCGKEIAHRKDNEKYCSNKCKAESMRKKRYCLVCSKEVREPHQFLCEKEKCRFIYRRCVEFAKNEYKKHHKKYLEKKEKSAIEPKQTLQGYRGKSWCKRYDDNDINCVMCYENKDKSNCEE